MNAPIRPACGFVLIDRFAFISTEGFREGLKNSVVALSCCWSIIGSARTEETQLQPFSVHLNRCSCQRHPAAFDFSCLDFSIKQKCILEQIDL